MPEVQLGSDLSSSLDTCKQSSSPSPPCLQKGVIVTLLTELLGGNEKVGALFILDCFINYRKVSGLKQHPFIISQFRGSEAGVGSTGFSAQGLTRSKSRLVSRSSEKASALKFIQVLTGLSSCGHRTEGDTAASRVVP